MKTNLTITRWFLLLLLTLPAVVQAQFNYTTNNGTITITGYTGPGGAVTIPSNILVNGVSLPVTSIGEEAFWDCTSLTNITIPSSVTNIDFGAFGYCTSLTSVTIPNSVTSIGQWAFWDCTSLTAITVNTGNPAYSSVAGVLFNKGQTTLIQYPGGLSGSYTIPNGVTNIQIYAFWYCSSLASVTIPNSVSNLGEEAFVGCSSLTAITVNAGNPAYSSAAGVLFNQSQTTLIQYPGGLSGSYTIPNSVTNIAFWAFQDCTRLSSVTMGTNVTTIGGNAFNSCSSLTNVTLGAAVTTIGGSAFYSCSSLTSVTIPNSVTNIGPEAFTRCASLTGITVNAGNPTYSSVAGVLFNKSQTTLIECPEAETGSYTIPNSVTNIGDYAFFSCGGLTSVTIPSSVTSIGEQAFDLCTGLTSVTIPNSVTSIGAEAFYVCSSLASVTIGTNVTSIEDYAFSDCSSLTSVTIPNSATNIGVYAFEECNDLTNVTIGSSVTSIGDDAFQECYSLRGVYLHGNAPSADSSVFSGDTNATVYYYPGTSGWSSPFAGVPAVMLNAPNPAGSLQVTITPPGAVAAGAQWQVDGGIPQPSGATVLGLSVGNHTVSYTAFSGWTAPSHQTVSVSANSTATTNGIFIPPPGSLQVTLTPAAAISAGAQWSVNGGAFQNSGATITNLPATNATVSFKAISGWATPSNQTVAIISDQTTNLVGTYLDTTRPTLSITNVTAGMNVSNAAFTVKGTAGDNVAVANVFYSLNNTGWSDALTGNNGSNWTAAVTLLPGTNTIAAYAVDTSGNLSVTSSVSFQYVVSGRLQVQLFGLGTISPNYSNAVLAIGQSYSLTASPGSGFVFTNWTGGTNLPLTLLTNGNTVRFVMATNLILQADFVDVTKPTLSITNLAAGQRVSNAVFTVKGTAGDNWQVGNVLCQINGGGWNSATNINNWTNWAAGVTLVPGTNVVRAYAVDTTGNLSVTSSVSCQYVVTNQLGVRSIGLGTINPNDSNAWLEVGRNYSIMASPASGFIVTNWTISTNWIGGVITNNATVQFMMASNLTLQVTFADVTKPTLSITNLAAGQRVSNTVFTVKGTAADNWQVSNVLCKVNGGEWNSATNMNNWTNWAAGVALVPGTNAVQAYAVDTTGNLSVTSSVSFQYVVTNQLGVRSIGLGTINPNDSNAWLEVGRNYSIAASPASGFIVTNWTISTNWLGGVKTNNATVQFMMASNLTLLVTFADVTKPTLTVSSPTAGQRMTNALANVTGTASDNWQVAGVWCQLNSNGWLLVTTTNTYTNWSQTLTLVAGTNTIKAYAVDLGGNYSATNTLSVISSNTFKLLLTLTNVPLTSTGLYFSLEVSSNLNGHIQVSSNLVNWLTLTNFVGTNSTLNFRDPAATTSDRRFYRAVIP